MDAACFDGGEKYTTKLSGEISSTKQGKKIVYLPRG